MHGDAAERTGYVITKDDYDKTYGEHDLLRRVLGTIVSRPLLLGASLNQDRTVRMMSEARDGGGVLTKHFALLEQDPKQGLDQQTRALTELGIQPIWYPPRRFDAIDRTTTRTSSHA